ncbi:MAG: hypothetical protein K9M45_01960 [Kiritimatiellales bacterium]|nr:hypothetical protein [Kiritimatiellales bacterium]
MQTKKEKTNIKGATPFFWRYLIAAISILSAPFVFGAGGEYKDVDNRGKSDSYDSQMSSIVINQPSRAEVELWLNNREEFKEQRLLHLKHERENAIHKLNDGLSKEDTIGLLNSLPVDPYSENIVVPAHYYKLWVYLRYISLDDAIINHALADGGGYMHMVDRNNTLLPNSPSTYIALSVYKDPTLSVLKRWILTDPRIKVRQDVLWYSFEYGKHPASFYLQICPEVIFKDSDATMKSWAAIILNSIDGGREKLMEIMGTAKANEDYLIEGLIETAMKHHPMVIPK